MLLRETFLNTYDELSYLYENADSSEFRQGTVEAGKPIDLATCRMIASDVLDIRGEVEESACLVYNSVLTRVAASVLPFRDGAEGKEVFLKLWRSAVYLLGGGVDLAKDGTNPVKTVARESLEEANIKLTNIKDSGASYWEYSKKPWVDKHVENPEDRWSGYYTWLFTADYDGTSNNDMPEEPGNFRWYKVSDILARPDTKKLKFIKQAIMNAGYANQATSADDNENLQALEEDALTEAKQVGLVSYAIRKSVTSKQHPLASLQNILSSNVIFASKEDTKGSGDYVSLSRDLLSHLKGSTDWSCGLILDGDKLSSKYKISAVNANSMVFFGDKQSSKQLVLRNIRKYQARDAHGNFVPDEFIYKVGLGGCSFTTLVSKAIYDVLKTIMLSYNARLAVKSDGAASEKYKNRINADVKKFYHIAGEQPIKDREAWLDYINKLRSEHPELAPEWLDAVADTMTDGKYPAWPGVGSKLRRGAPKSKSEYDWICVEAYGYNTPNSGLILRLGSDESANSLRSFADEVKEKHSVDVTDPNFFKQLGGQYADEAEERVRARLVTFIERHYTKTTADVEKHTVSGIDINGCIKAILIHEKHRMVFKDMSEEDLAANKTAFLFVNGEYLDGKTTVLPDGSEIKKPRRVDNIPNLTSIALNIRHMAASAGLDIILFNDNSTNRDIIAKIQ